MKKFKFTFALIICVLTSLTLTLSACGGGGGGGSTGGGGGGGSEEDTKRNPPSKIANLTVSLGSKFGDISIGWNAPTPAAGSRVQTYELAYSTTNISASQFSSLPKLSQAMTPQSAGGAENLAFNISSLAANTFYRGSNLYIAVRSVSDYGTASEISNVVSVKVPWQTKIKAYLKSDSGKWTDSTFGIQGNASAALDNFDVLMPPEYTLNDFYGYFSEPSLQLLVDMHTDFTIDDKWTFYVRGVPLSVIKIEFPGYDSNGPFASSVTLIEKTTGATDRQFDVPGGLSNAEFTLDGSGNGIFEIYIN